LNGLVKRLTYYLILKSEFMYHEGMCFSEEKLYPVVFLFDIKSDLNLLGGFDNEKNYN